MPSTSSKKRTTRGKKVKWGTISPKRGGDRDKLLKSCGSRCFLMPKEKKFPICRRCSGEACSCKPDCTGLRAARIRAAQWHYSKVKDTAERMMSKYHCSGLSKKKKKAKRGKSSKSGA